MILGLVSAKGSPGVTSIALALAARAGEHATLVEFDPSGGSIECWTGAPHEPGLSRVASSLRRSVDAEAVAIGVRQIPNGIRVVHAPTSGSVAESTIAAIGERLTVALADEESLVVVDAGRWCRSQVTARRVSGCDVIAIVCQPTLAGVEAARALIDPIEAVTGLWPMLVLVGDRPYSPAEVAAATGLGVLGCVPWDPRSLNALVANGVFRGFTRLPLGRSAQVILLELAKHTTSVVSAGVAS